MPYINASISGNLRQGGSDKSGRFTNPVFRPNLVNRLCLWVGPDCLELFGGAEIRLDRFEDLLLRVHLGFGNTVCDQQSTLDIKLVLVAFSRVDRYGLPVWSAEQSDSLS